jgi:hypothetical protein
VSARRGVAGGTSPTPARAATSETNGLAAAMAAISTSVRSSSGVTEAQADARPVRRGRVPRSAPTIYGRAQRRVHRLEPEPELAHPRAHASGLPGTTEIWITADRAGINDYVFDAVYPVPAGNDYYLIIPTPSSWAAPSTAAR